MKSRLLKWWNFLFAFWLKVFTLPSPATGLIWRYSDSIFPPLVTLSRWWYAVKREDDFHKDRPHFWCVPRMCFVIPTSDWLVASSKLFKVSEEACRTISNSHSPTIWVSLSIQSLTGTYSRISFLFPEETPLKNPTQRFSCSVRAKWTFDSFKLVVKHFEALQLHLFLSHKYKAMLRCSIEQLSISCAELWWYMLSLQEHAFVHIYVCDVGVGVKYFCVYLES